MGDVVAVGEAPLAVAKAGWTPVVGGLNEVRIHEHGTHALPATARDHAAEGDDEGEPEI